MARYFIGTSGWHYDDWRKRFYPEKLPKTAWLEYYGHRFPTVELNNSFYRLPTEAAFRNWYRQTPEGFVFAVKASRYITHVKRLKDTAEALGKLAPRAKLLKEKLGPLLYQLPPTLHRDDDRLAAFLAALPPGLKHAIEFRHPSWLEEEVFTILKRHRAGFCVFDMPELRTPLRATASFAYIRFHGHEGLYDSNYQDAALAEWADGISAMSAELEEVYIYFNNDVSGYAIKNAVTLRRLLEWS